jgi:uncharacterized protein (DUF302 family)
MPVKSRPSKSSRFAAGCVAALTVIAFAAPVPARADELVTRTKKGTFDDVRFDLGNAVIATGVAVQSEGNVAAMLGRTAADVGAVETVYNRAEFVSFCSAKYSRAMMEADATNMGFCPFVVFAYETKAKPGEIVVGYRRPLVPATQNAAAQKAAADVDALLAKIVAETVK